jgi:hypothetical protein
VPATATGASACDPFPGAGSVIVHADVDALGDAKRAGIASRLCQLLAYEAHFPGELRRGCRSGAEKAIAELNRAP